MEQTVVVKVENLHEDIIVPSVIQEIETPTSPILNPIGSVLASLLAAAELIENIKKEEFNCKICKKSFETIDKLNEHCNVDHLQEKKQKRWKCSICQSTFATKPGLDKHKKSHSSSYKAPPRMNHSKCTICQLMFTTAKDLSRHRKLYPRRKCAVLAKVSGSNPGKQLRCIQRQCTEKFSTRQDLAEHMKQNHSRNLTFKCKYCSRICRDSFDQKRHEKRNHAFNKISGQVEYTCQYPDCHQVFSHPSQLKSHELASHVKNAVKCKVCARKFQNRAELKKHGAVHSDVRPHKCRHCGKMFKNRGDANRCERVHAGHGVYKCRFCNKLCRDKGVLNKHEQIHTGLKTFSCEKCGKSLGTAYSLKMHQKTHRTSKKNKT